MKVGIPRALFFYHYSPLWREFLTGLGAEVVYSPATNKKILEAGLGASLSEACLPVKLFFGHTLALVEEVDYILVPRLVSIESKAYICPKFIGLPDMLRARLTGLPPLIDSIMDVRREKTEPEKNWQRFFEDAGHFLTGDGALIHAAARRALLADKIYRSMLARGLLPSEILASEDAPQIAAGAQVAEQPLRIGLLGHPYLLYDDYINMGLIGKLRQLGADLTTSESVPGDQVEAQLHKLPKRLFWTLGRRIIGSALYFMASRQLDGLLYVESFGCGPESLVGYLVERWVQRYGQIPFMSLTIDEHSGEAGLVTRLEAFTDMIKRRKKSESHIPAHGEHLYSH